MGKTTNILDLNNRLTKVEKENVAQNSYTSLKNKPKINNVTLTGNKSLADIGAAAASDLTTLAGDVNDLMDGLSDIVYYSANVGGNYVSDADYILNSFTIVDPGIYLITGRQYLALDATYNYVRAVLKIKKGNSVISQKVSAIKQSVEIMDVIRCNANDVISLTLTCNVDINNLNTDISASLLKVIKLSNKEV